MNANARLTILIVQIAFLFLQVAVGLLGWARARRGSYPDGQFELGAAAAIGPLVCVLGLVVALS